MIELKNDGLADGRYTDEDGYYYSVTRLIEYSKNLPIFEMPLAGIHIGEKVFAESRTARSIAEHVKRVNETCLDYPILLSPDGFIMDGWHRVIRALVEGKETINAIRFKELPPVDGKRED